MTIDIVTSDKRRSLPARTTRSRPVEDTDYTFAAIDFGFSDT